MTHDAQSPQFLWNKALPFSSWREPGDCGYQGIILMNLDTRPISATLVCSQTFYNSSPTSAFWKKTSSSWDPHPELSKKWGLISQVLEIVVGNARVQLLLAQHISLT